MAAFSAKPRIMVVPDWLNDMFDSNPAGYWGSDLFEEMIAPMLLIVADHNRP